MLRLSELYASIQGEGPGVSKLTQFIRFGGCNLRCPGWPCDTLHAIDTERYRHEWEKIDALSITERLATTPQRVVFTGGEPFLQPAKDLQDLAASLIGRDYTIEIFTNGTLMFPDWVQNLSVSVIMDWKLLGSGEDPFNGVRIQNLDKLGAKDAVKFVVKDEQDLDQACLLYWQHLHSRRIPIYVGAAWGHIKEAELVDWIKESGLDWRLNVQLQNHIWDRSLRGI